MPLRTSTPGLVWQTRKNGKKYAFWIPTKKQSGGRGKFLWSGIKPTQDDLDRISGACMRLYAEFRVEVDRRKGTPQPGQIYFIKCGDLVKIGYTTKFSQRLESIRTACPAEVSVLLVVPGTRKGEQDLHRQFAHLRRAGEWFALDAEIGALIERRSNVAEAA